MTESGLHVVFGVGQVGQALVSRLVTLDLPVRAVSLHRPPMLDDGADWRDADATDPEAAADAAKGGEFFRCRITGYDVHSRTQSSL